ncbi:MAG TPA: hypothetical protein VE978_04270 [Chitinophagales bacterium]|nr:hypothetical protein [Chitinophagales bacterium]
MIKDLEFRKIIFNLGLLLLPFPLMPLVVFAKGQAAPDQHPKLYKENKKRRYLSVFSALA